MSSSARVAAATTCFSNTTFPTSRSRTASRQTSAPGRRVAAPVPLGAYHRTRTTTASSAAFVDVGEEIQSEQSQLNGHEEDPNQKGPHRVVTPQKELPFSVGEIRRAIPPHCFERSLLRSFAYLAGDLVAIAGLVYASTFIDALPVAMAVKYGILWPMYWFWVGAFGVGVWIVSHECGHGAFSEHNWVNDAVGLFGHSLLFVPYFSWKHSHRRHHANTGSLKYDEAFVPHIREEVHEDDYIDIFRLNGVSRAISLVLMLVFGFPLYLMMNLGGHEYKGWPNHFNPWSPVFEQRERLEVFISDLGLAAVVLGLCIVGQNFGFATVLKTYIIPYFVVHVWLVLITFLHHTNPKCPHFDDKEWTWLKGALSTIDRNFGFLNVLFHRITDTHVLHHLFSQIPHYHALEATEAIKPILGEHYKSDERHLLKALWEDFRDTKYVAPDRKGDGVLWYRN